MPESAPASRMSRPLVIALAIGASLIVAGVLMWLLKPDDDAPSTTAVNAAWATGLPKGAVRFCSGTDVSGAQRRTQRDYNERFPDSVATFDEASFVADSQHDLYLKLIEQGRDDCDVIYLDVIYMAEFAAKDLLYDLSPYLTPARRAEFDDQMIDAAAHDGKLWGVPKQRDVGALYYRTDLEDPPLSWQHVYRQAKSRSATEKPGLRLPLGSFEGLTVVFLELAYAAGAPSIVTADGERARITGPSALKALKFLRDAKREGVIPDLNQQTDPGNLAVYELGRASFLRGWPFVASRLREDAGTGRTAGARQARQAAAENTDIIPLPPWEARGESIGILGGHELVIPRSAKNPSAAMRLIDFMTSDAQVRKDETEDSQYPVLKSVADDLDVRHRKLIDAIKATTVIPRPTIPGYAAVSTIISTGVKEIIDGPADDALAQDKLDEMHRDVQKVLDQDPP
ncbi:MAG: extracellular solute-binding protein [Chloroflexi bacterium]|nr:extracellular solute-binding protein [Chloroflexota bacterium]